jgi:nitrate reductase NapD
MNITGVLLQVNPGRMDEVRAALDRFAGVEVHMVTEDGRLIVTVEEEDSQGGTVLALHRLEGVLAASVTYHYFGPESEDDKDGVPSDETITA